MHALNVQYIKMSEIFCLLNNIHLSNFVVYSSYQKLYLLLFCPIYYESDD